MLLQLFQDYSQTFWDRVSCTEEGNHSPSKINLRIFINHMEVIEFLNRIISFDKEFGQLNGQLRTKYQAPYASAKR